MKSIRISNTSATVQSIVSVLSSLGSELSGSVFLPLSDLLFLPLEQSLQINNPQIATDLWKTQFQLPAETCKCKWTKKGAEEAERVVTNLGEVLAKFVTSQRAD